MRAADHDHGMRRTRPGANCSSPALVAQHHTLGAGKLLDGVHKEAVELESRTNRRQFGAIRIELGNLRLCRTAWWAREDSNLQPSGYEPLALTIELRAPKTTRAKGQAVSTILYRIVLPNLAGSIKIPPVRRTDSRTTTAFSAACARPRR